MPSSRRKARNDGVARTADGRPFHARGAATRKAERAGRRKPSSGGDDGRRRQPPDGCRPRSTAGRCRSDNGASEHRGGSDYLAPNGHIRSSGLHHVGDLTCCRLHYTIFQQVCRGGVFDVVIIDRAGASGGHCHGTSLITASANGERRRRLCCVLNQNELHRASKKSRHF